MGYFLYGSADGLRRMNTLEEEEDMISNLYQSVAKNVQAAAACD